MGERGYRIVPFPTERRFQADAAWMQRRKQTISGLFEVDITGVQERMRQHRAATGESYSLTAYLVWRLAQAVDENKEVQAMRNWRNRLVIFDDVDVATLIEISLQGRSFPLLHVIRAANRRHYRQIQGEIRAIQADPTRSENFGERKQNQARWFLALPAAARRLCYLLALRQPHWFRQLGGTVALSSVGMFADGGGWGLAGVNHSLAVTIGGIARKPGVMDGRIAIRDYLCLTVGFDHEIIDGAPAARFASRLKELIECDEGFAGGSRSAHRDVCGAGSGSGAATPSFVGGVCCEDNPFV